MQAFSAFTNEIDDVAAAVAEICGQLESCDLKQHSIGILSCVPEFVEAGTVAALAQALPFRLVGSSTLSAASPHSTDLDCLSLLVLSSDEVQFAVGCSEPISTVNPAVVTDTYQQAAAAYAEQPSLILCFAPFILNAVGGDFFVNALDSVSGNVPIFGSLASDNTIDYAKCSVLCDDQSYSDRMVCVLCYGPLKPVFHVATISSKKMANVIGQVTSCENNVIKEVNGQPLVEFLKNNGLASGPDGQFESLYSFPLYVDNNDGTVPVIRILLKTTPEGYGICGGEVSLGATISVGYLDEGEVLATTQRKLDELDLEDAHAILLFSCIGRFFALGYGYEGEAEEIHEKLDASSVAYSFAYSGGEICPVRGKTDSSVLANRFHNSTFIAMVI
ncbi:MAG: FIST C-terminal domain-containing protein [Coriobacteriales bacterium]|jgi:hypothetical protein|nr:FIST C-terminal domain-containing protein [Coriobacteriales bacterium]